LFLACSSISSKEIIGLFSSTIDGVADSSFGIIGSMLAGVTTGSMLAGVTMGSMLAAGSF